MDTFVQFLGYNRLQLYSPAFETAATCHWLIFLVYEFCKQQVWGPMAKALPLATNKIMNRLCVAVGCTVGVQM